MKPLYQKPEFPSSCCDRILGAGVAFLVAGFASAIADAPDFLAGAFIAIGGALGLLLILVCTWHDRRVRRYLATVCVLLLCLSFSAAALAQYAPPQQYAIGWQPVAIPGQYYAVPRSLWITNALFGPRVVFIPAPPRQYPGPVQPQMGYAPQPQQLPPPQPQP